MLSFLCLVAQSFWTLCDLMDCSLPRSSVHRSSPGKNTGVGCHALLQGIFPTQGLNPGLPHCRHILYHLSQHRSPFIHCQSKQVIQPFCDSVSPSRMLKDLLKEWFQFSLLSLGPCSAESVSVGFYLILVTSLEKAMAPHSSTLAWKITWMEEPGGLQSMGSLRVGHD